MTELRVEELPGRDLVEHLEQQRAEDDLGRCLVSSVDDLRDEVLADSVGCPVAVGEPVVVQDWVLGPGSRLSVETGLVDRLTPGREGPVGVEDDRRSQAATCNDEVRRRFAIRLDDLVGTPERSLHLGQLTRSFHDASRTSDAKPH